MIPGGKDEYCLRGLYAITDAGLTPDRQTLTGAVEAAIRGGARVIQYRDKGADCARRKSEAQALMTLCQPAGIPLIINDDVTLAEMINADGVHLGKNDSKLTHARDRLGPNAIIGISCYNSLERARAAARAGADYVAFGSVFPSPTKPDAVQAPLELFAQARQSLNIPIAAIGGLTPPNAAPIIAAGVNLLAVISGVFGAPDTETAARSYTDLFDRWTQS